MNADLIRLIKIYGTCPHRAVSEYLNSKSKKDLVAIILDLTTEYYNDKNSSTLREFLLVTLCGFAPLREKIGYNGYRKTGIGSKTVHCEAKPKNINTNNWNGKSKLNGGGNFTDYSWKKLSRHKRENPQMLVGGFINGRLIYIFEFPFNSVVFTDKIKAQLQRQYPNGDEIGKFLRSAAFGFNDYKDITQLKARVFVENLVDYERYITTPLFKFLQTLPKP